MSNASRRKPFDIKEPVEKYDFWIDAEAAAKAYLDYERFDEQVENLQYEAHETVTQNAENFISSTERTAKNEAIDEYNKKTRAPVVTGLILYGIAAIIVCVLTYGFFIKYFLPINLFIIPCALVLTGVYEDYIKDNFSWAPIVMAVLALASVGIDAYLLYEFFSVNVVCTVICAILFIAARIFANILPLFNKTSKDELIRQRLRKATTSEEYKLGLKRARERDAEETSRCQTTAKRELGEVLKDKQTVEQPYRLYKSLCSLMLEYAKQSIAYDQNADDPIEHEYEIMHGINQRIGPFSGDEKYLPRDIYAEAFKEFEQSRKDIQASVERINKLLDEM